MVENTYAREIQALCFNCSKEMEKVKEIREKYVHTKLQENRHYNILASRGESRVKEKQ